MTKHAALGALMWLLMAPHAPAQQKQAGAATNRITLGRLGNGASVSFVRAGSGDWGIEIAGGAAPRMAQPKPAQIRVFRSGDRMAQLSAGYNSVQRSSNGILARAKVGGKSSAAFSVEDRWNLSGAVLSLQRKVSVTSPEEGAGFYSAIRLVTDPKIAWGDVDCLAPGLLYADPQYDGANSPGGTAYYRAKRFSIREDNFSAPVFGVSFRDGQWAAVLDMTPKGDTTQAETTAPAATPVIDERLQFGALGASELPEGGIEFGFWLPGTTSEIGGGRGAPPTPVVRHRYHPVKAGFAHTYAVGFRFGQNAPFRGMQREAWRWAWDTLKPKAKTVDLEVARRAMLDHLQDHVVISNGLTGVPFLYDAVTGRPGSYRRRPASAAAPASTQAGQPQQQPGRGTQAGQGAPPAFPGRGAADPEYLKQLAAWTKTVGIDLDPQANELDLFPKVQMGFVSKGIEVADQLLIEADRDPSERGQRMRKSGLAIIDSFLKVPMAPPAGEGFNLMTGKPDSRNGVFSLRAPSEDMRTLIDTYRREKKAGRNHPEWLNWCLTLADWLLTQQREDGSFPRSWNSGKGDVRETSGTSSYNPVPLLVRLTEETGRRTYLDAAIRAADYVWANYGSKGVFIGGATDNPNIVDKEAGMLSLEAFLALYENTKQPKWLERAQAAGSYAESWVWIWNVPMPVDANDSELNWKRGVSTVGSQGITAQAFATVDEYMAWSVPAFAKLYKYTNDSHYLDVARVLLHGSKAMLALPGRSYDLLGPGWSQEHWKMGPNTRGVGGHRSWLPWVSVNHLHGITGLEQLDPALFQKLAKGN